MSIRAAFISAGVPGSTAGREAPFAAPAMRERGITSQRAARFFLAQVLHESGRLRYFEEIASGTAYEGRRDLGNVKPGDGKRYKGRGPIQLTGRANYRVAGKALKLPLEAHPYIASRHHIGWRIATWYWQSHGLTALAERGDFIGVTRRINGGTNGLADRQACLRAVSKHDCQPTSLLDVLSSPERVHAERLLWHRREYKREAKTGRGPKFQAHKRHAASHRSWIEQRIKVLESRIRHEGRAHKRPQRVAVLKQVVRATDGTL